jgi:hypothetical protein
MQEADRRRKQEAAQQAAIDAYIGGLPEDQRARFRAFPTQAADAMFREQPEQFVQLTKRQAAERGLPTDKVFQASTKTGKISQVGGGQTIQNIIGGSKVGTIPPGFELVEDPRTGALSMRPIPGGPAEKAEMEEAEKAKGRKEQQARAGGTVVQDLQRALNIVQTNPSATGRTAAATELLPGVARAETDYQSARGFVESALSNVGLDTLQQMRENSPTGGALGQVPIQQQQRLEQVLGSLDLTQRKEVVEDNIKRVINIYMDIIHGSREQVEDAFNRGEITAEQRKTFGFRHSLSFDELGNPLGKGKGRSLRDIFGGGR